jgi:hypothetical protein
VLGLGAIGLLLSVPLIMKVVRKFVGWRLPGDEPPVHDDNAVDADAMIARYKAQQSTDPAPPPRAPKAAPPVSKLAPSASRPSFGRRTR